MAADILLYQPDMVPVGDDQTQHVELTRTLARKFNSRFGETFKEPKALIQKEGARIMGLDDPTKKMSKSASSANNYIGMLDSADEIIRKIKIAVTDSGSEIKYNPQNKPGISNLLVIMSQMSDIPIKTLEEKYANKSYGEFKAEAGELLAEKLAPIQKKYDELIGNPKIILEIMESGAKDAEKIALRTLKDVKEKIGLI